VSPHTAAQYERIKDERQAEILGAALPIFARKGLAATKMADVATAAGVSYGLVYHYFPTKDAIYAALVEDALRGALAVAEEALGRDGSPWERLVWLCERMLAGVQHHPEYPLLILQAYTSEIVPPDARAALERYGQRTSQKVSELIQQGQAAGQVATGDTLELATVFLAAIQGVALHRLEAHAVSRPFPRSQTVLRLLEV